MTASFWTAVETLLAAAFEADPQRAQTIIDSVAARSTADREGENLQAVIAAVRRHPGCTARQLRDHARAEARARVGRGLIATEHEAAVRSALADGLIRREGNRTRGFRFFAVSHAATHAYDDEAVAA
jgi:hypothetical protein